MYSIMDLTDANCGRIHNLFTFRFKAIRPISKGLSSPVLFIISARTEQQASLGFFPLKEKTRITFSADLLLYISHTIYVCLDLHITL